MQAYQLPYMETPAQFRHLKAYYQHIMPSLTEESWQICEAVLNVRTLKKGEMLLRQGCVCNHVSFINHGLVRMYYLVDGKEKITEFFKEGSYTSDYRSFLLREPSLTAVQALEDTEVVDTSFEDLQMIYKSVPEANLLGRLIAETLFIDICRKNSSHASDSIDGQYAHLLTEKPWLAQRVPQYMIASYLGITPEAMSRVKARMIRKPRPVAIAY